MAHHYARLIVVTIATVSFSTPITAQQEPTSPPTVEMLVETLGGYVNQNEQGEVVEVLLSRTRVTDAGVAELQKALPNCAIRLQAPILDPIFIPPFPPQ